MVKILSPHTRVDFLETPPLVWLIESKFSVSSAAKEGAHLASMFSGVTTMKPPFLVKKPDVLSFKYHFKRYRKGV